MSQHDEFIAALIKGNARELVEMWKVIAPHLPVPEDLGQAEIVMHRARTEISSIPFSCRAYSHAWLTERNFPSGLPDILKPKAERLYPKVVAGVGIAVMMKPQYADAASEIRRSMELAVEDCFADGVTDPDIVRSQMMIAREKTKKVLFGTLKVME